MFDQVRLNAAINLATQRIEAANFAADHRDWLEAFTVLANARDEITRLQQAMPVRLAIDDPMAQATLSDAGLTWAGPIETKRGPGRPRKDAA